jgi:hypothetical protein
MIIIFLTLLLTLYYAVSNRVAITAAHCISEKRSLSPIRAADCHFVFGANNLRHLDTDAQVTRVNQFILHPSWNPNELKFNGDVALAILNSFIEYNNFIRPVCLPPARSNSQDIENRNAFVGGWGKISLKSQIIHLLLFLIC